MSAHGARKAQLPQPESVLDQNYQTTADWLTVQIHAHNAELKWLSF